jgi:hypothetical protein
MTHDPQWAYLSVGLFVLYMLLVSVVCFNLLIAILGESYDRVQVRVARRAKCRRADQQLSDTDSSCRTDPAVAWPCPSLRPPLRPS